MGVHWLVPDGWEREIDIGLGMRMLWYKDVGWCIEHDCIAGDGVPARNAPSISAHTVTENDTVTVTPSILCGGCNLHGFVTDSKWRAA